MKTIDDNNWMWWIDNFLVMYLIFTAQDSDELKRYAELAGIEPQELEDKKSQG